MIILPLLVMAGPAGAKGPALTFEVLTETPVGGGSVTIELRTWEWRPDGSADTSRPWPFPEGFHDRVHLDLELRTGGWDRDDGGWKSKPIQMPGFHRVGPTAYRTIVRLPSPGIWRFAWAGEAVMGIAESEEGLPTFRVYPAEERTAGGGPGLGLAGLGLLIAGVAVRERQRAREETRGAGR